MLKKNQLFLIFHIVLVVISCNTKKSEYIDYNKGSDDVFVSNHIIPDGNFLGDQKCKECHLDEYMQWQGSHHDKAMQIAIDTTILGNFDNVKFKSQGVINHFFKKDSTYYVNTEGPDGNYHDYKIEYTYGVKPLQQYIVKFPNGHLQCLRTAWDTEKKVWFDLYPDFKVVHSEWLHWSRGGLNWNTMCSDCHSTNVRKNYSQKDHSYDTKYALINVSCEACHGPGKMHVANAIRQGVNYKNLDDLKMASNIDKKELVDQCARCHMRREQISSHFNFEGTMLDHYFPELLNTRTYHPDGQILDEVYVYGSFVQSKMYQNNVSCNDCHNSHSLKLKFDGNQLCLQCHVPETYNTPSHHFHNMNTEASQCINCHMTGKYYMVNDFRRDHSFRVPRPDLSIKYGTPNACTGCHEDKDNEWAWEHFKKNYGQPKNKHFSDLLAPGLLGTQNGLEALEELAKDTVYPDMARASAVRGMESYLHNNSINALIGFLNDKSPLVRGASLDVIGNIEVTHNNLLRLLHLLEDEKRSVRVKAFFALSTIDEILIPQDHKETYEKAKKEFEIYLNSISDFVGGRIKRANYHLKKGDLNAAIKGYESAIEIDEINNLARTTLANLYYRNGQITEAEKAFQTIIEQEPEYGPTYYSYGLLLAELNRIPEAINQLTVASSHMPENTRVYYNLSLLFDKLNDLNKAESTVVQGLKQNPNSEDLLYMLAYIYSKDNKIEKALSITKRLVQLFPDNPNYRAMMNRLSSSE